MYEADTADLCKAQRSEPATFKTQIQTQRSCWMPSFQVEHVHPPLTRQDTKHCYTETAIVVLGCGLLFVAPSAAPIPMK